MHKAKHLLLAPLDWGMGHTTRCIPVLRHLQALGHKVTFAGNEAQCAFIRSANNVDTLHLPGYDITYSTNRSTFLLHLLGQVPAILRSVKREHLWLQDMQSHYRFDGVISDNRYGLYHTGTPSVIMTHQLRIPTGMGNLADGMVRQLHYHFLNRFNERWVVDTEGLPNLAGKLSHPVSLPARTHYIGLLSQLKRRPEEPGGSLLVLLSGPEPQRTILADLLWEQVTNYPGQVIFIEGRANTTRSNVPGHIQWLAQVNDAELQPLMQKASVVICRAGYSTIMDLVALNKKAILIPTPGQAEQEYLATTLHRNRYFYSGEQSSFDLEHAVKTVMQSSFVHNFQDTVFEEYIPVLKKWVSGI